MTPTPETDERTAVSDLPAEAAHDNTHLVNRIIEARIAKWLAAAFATVRAGDLDESALKAVDELQHLHLSGADYAVVPGIVADLRRAGLVTEAQEVADHG